MRSLKDYLVVMLKGMAMGAADVVPGVSGGTIALITGIYNELLHSLKNLGPDALVVLFRQGLPACWKYTNANFLIAVFLGIAISIKTFAAIIGYCLTHYPLLVWGFFSGLIIASVWLLAKQQSEWKWNQWLLCVLGAVFVVFVAMSKPTQLEPTYTFVFLGGFVAICAMILPGISGSFILLLLGLYPVILAAVNDLNIALLATFLAGCVAGLLVFSRFLAWLLDRFYRSTLAVLIGFLIGSLYVTWPWKHTIKTYIDRHGELVPLLQENVSPFSYPSIVGGGHQLVWVILAFVLGAFLVLMVEFLGQKLRTHSH